MPDTDLSAALDGMRRRARQITDEHAADDCDLDGETCTGHDAELLLAAVEAALAVAVDCDRRVVECVSATQAETLTDCAERFRAAISRALLGEEAAP